MILKQDNGRGVVIVNHSSYKGKYFFIFNSSQFTQLRNDLTMSYQKIEVNITIKYFFKDLFIWFMS